MMSVALRRAASLGAALLVCMIAVGVRLGYVQGVRSEEYSAEARRQRVREITLPARRGAIRDRHGRELAVSVPARTVYANPHQVSDPTGTARSLAKLLDRSVAALDADLRRNTGFVYLARRIGLVTARKVEALGLPGVGIVDEARRLYPGGTLAAGVVGFIGTDQKGLAGLEYGYEELLGGRPGYRVLEQDPRGRRIPQGTFSEVAPVPGADIELTIESDLQFAAEDALARAVEHTEAKGGMVVALDPHTGEILAMASFPTYDPNLLGHIDPATTRNRVVTDAFEPGSINKVVTASAALTEGVIKPGEQMWVPPRMVVADKVFTEKRGARSLDLRGILAQSSNLGTIRLAQKLGPDKLDAYLQRFGYGRGTGLGFPGESAGMLPSASLYATTLPTMAIGQSLSVTPLQIAQVYATIANDGITIEPRLVSAWVDPLGERHEVLGARKHRVIPAGVARTVRAMLESVVTEGTGVAARIPGQVVSGKTGTASKQIEGVGYRGYMASFFGMFPAHDPRLVIGVVLDDPVPNEGGLAAAPVFSEIGSQAVRLMRMPPEVPIVPAQPPPSAGVVGR